MRKWYELRSHAINNKSIIMSKKDYENGLLEQLSLAIEFEHDKNVKNRLKEEYTRLTSESIKYALVKKTAAAKETEYENI